MPLVDIRPTAGVFMPECRTSRIAKITAAAASACALALIGAGTSSVSAASLSRSMEVKGVPAEVWSMIGPFCAIGEWHPAIGTCTEDGKSPPTRTLVTKDGKATFVEMQTARSDAKHLYSYNFISSPLPVSGYEGTIEVDAKGNGSSTVTWRCVYTPHPGKEKDASDALTGIYDAGLKAIKAKLAK